MSFRHIRKSHQNIKIHWKGKNLKKRVWVLSSHPRNHASYKSYTNKTRKQNNHLSILVWTHSCHQSSYQIWKLRGFAFTKYNYFENAWKWSSFITPRKIVELKWRDNMINYTCMHPFTTVSQSKQNDEKHSDDNGIRYMQLQVW